MKVLSICAAALASVLSFSTLAQAPKTFKMPANVKQADVMPNRIVAKVKSVEGINSPAVQYALIDIGTVKHYRKFPYAQAPKQAYNAQGLKYANLSLVYEIEYNSSLGLEQAINRLLATGIFEYVEPHYIPHTTFTPNDPQAGSQYHLAKINALNAWDIAQGDTNVVVGITDTGIELTHSDLASQVKRNPADPINNIDDDGDGYIDNYRGWDIGENDNNPSNPAGSAHGVHVSGLAGAATNNNVGIAGIGFKCKLLPVKIADGTGALVAAYEGITYAADHGCKVINCSWGSSVYSSVGQDVIDYATVNKDALVVCAAGNDASDELFYPASYNYVLNVASTNSNDRKSTFSNYGFNIDVCAPGDNVLSTWEGNSYVNSSGTSMASPVTAGAAALIRAQFPSYNALQTGEKLRVTADFIDNVPGNSFFATKLGKGRINLYRALTENNSPAVVMTSNTMTDGNDNAFIAGDTVDLKAIFTNFLAPTSNLTAVLSTTSIFVDIIQPNATLGAIATLGTANNNASPFILVVKPNCPINQDVQLKVTMTDGSYTNIQYLTIKFNVDYINIAINDVATTITSKGRIGYNFDNQTEGLGFTYMNGPTLMYEGGLMIGTTTATVSDYVRGASGASSDVDFQSLQLVQGVVPAVISEFDAKGRFRDNVAITPIGIDVLHDAYAWTTTSDRKYIMVRYRIINNSAAALSDLYAGIFSDWDIMDFNKNKADYDVATRMGYAYSTEQNGLYAGIKLLSPGTVNVYSIDNVDGGNGGINMFDGFTTDEKYLSLATPRASAGNGTAEGVDVIHTVSSGPFNVDAGDTVEVAFALIAGESFDDLKSSAAAAQVKYDGLDFSVTQPTGITELTNPYQIRTFPNPASGSLFLSVSATKQGKLSFTLVDVAGRAVAAEVHNQGVGKTQYLMDISTLNAGVYFLQIDTPQGRTVNKVVVK